MNRLGHACVGLLAFALCSRANAQSLYLVEDAPPQPAIAQAQRIAGALETIGSALTPDEAARLKALSDTPHDEALSKAVQELLDPHCLAMVHINPEMRVRVMRGPATPHLIQNGWVTYLVKVHNQSGTQAPLNAVSPQAEPALHASSSQPRPKPENELSLGQVADRFLELQFFRSQPMTETLTGATLEYTILQMYTSAVGPREVQLSFNAGAGTEDLAARNSLAILFQSAPAVKVVFRVRDHDGKPTMASFTIRDNIDRLTKQSEPGAPKEYRHAKAMNSPWESANSPVRRLQGIYPLPSRRVAMTDEYPDFYFQAQVYRADREHVYLPPGTYDVFFTRGPEYIPDARTIQVTGDTPEQTETFDLKRWVNMAALGWYSADHHVHAGGCSHYESPEAGVSPASMFRQALGEDLNVSCVLTWGPCWYHQKTFFDGAIRMLSTPTNVMRYDVEVSGFPSSHAGHICLLRLREDDYPNTTLIEEWPSWTLPVLQWAQAQGGVVGYAHSGWGLAPVVPTDDLPNYVVPKMDGIGANEFIVTTAHGACDFISMVDTPAPWELNMWYHTLNCGMRTRISGETDFPCIFDERVGIGRSYAKVASPVSFDAYVEEIRKGANYVGDGKSHLIDFFVEDVEMGTNGSELELKRPDAVKVRVKAAAYLPEIQDALGALIARRNPTAPPYWDLERARMGESRDVTVELVVNGYPAASKTIAADGQFVDLEFEHKVEFSSWIAVRILGSSHTNPIFVLVDDKPVYASRRSAEWCIKSVDRCLEMKRKAIRPTEIAAAEAAYQYARRRYEAALDGAPAE